MAIEFFDNTCRSCGGRTEHVGNLFVCKHCGGIWEIITEDSMQVKLQNAWGALRERDFDRSAELFEDIIVEDKQIYEAYWGKALAQNGIVFVNDLNEYKKVPTCNNITENKFTENKDVKKAISMAPAQIAEDYKGFAEKIEKIRIEWLEKASKEPPYDVFICFKDTYEEDGVKKRTDDSIVAQDIYTFLVDRGYKVFFSRISLHGLISEQYEPYIYNAIKTAKVMIVYGQKEEYFNSVWLKNEWTRFRTRIEKGEKHKNSLVVAYENMDASELPVALKARQCLNAADKTFLTDLTAHIEKVIELSNQNVRLDRIKVEGGQISKKASQIAVNSVKTREIGEGATAETDISEKNRLDLISSYLEMQSWEDANGLISEILFDNPGCAEALWYKLLAKYKAKNEQSFNNILSSRTARFDDFATVDKLLNCASKDFAAHVLDFFYNLNAGYDELYTGVLKCILPYSYSKREQNIQASFRFVTLREYSQAFELLLSTLESDEVDRYIEYNLAFVKTVSDKNQKLKCLNNILAVDDGNIEALKLRFSIDLAHDSAVEMITADFEALLKYVGDPDKEINDTINILTQRFFVLKKNNVAFMKQLLRYYSGNLSDIKDRLLIFADKLLELNFKNDTEYFYNLVLSIDKNCAEAFWGLCLMKIGAKNENDILNCSKPIKSCPEFNKYLSLVDRNRQISCIELAKKQESIHAAKVNDTRNKELKDRYNKLVEQRDEMKRQFERVSSDIEAAKNKRKSLESEKKLIRYSIINMLLSISGLLLFIYHVSGGDFEPIVMIPMLMFIAGWCMSFRCVLKLVKNPRSCSGGIIIYICIMSCFIIHFIFPIILLIKTLAVYIPQSNDVKSDMANYSRTLSSIRKSMEEGRREIEKISSEIKFEKTEQGNIKGLNDAMGNAPKAPHIPTWGCVYCGYKNPLGTHKCEKCGKS